jgi:hypothetical protein
MVHHNDRKLTIDASTYHKGSGQYEQTEGIQWRISCWEVGMHARSGRREISTTGTEAFYSTKVPKTATAADYYARLCMGSRLAVKEAVRFLYTHATTPIGLVTSKLSKRR